MERIRSLPLMNFPDTGGVADKYGVSRISGVKGTPYQNIEETFRKSVRLGDRMQKYRHLRQNNIESVDGGIEKGCGS